MRRGALMLVGLGLLFPTSSAATTVTIGPAAGAAELVAPCPAIYGCESLTYVQRKLADPSLIVAAPVDGVVTGWRVIGSGNLRLRVLRPAGEALIGSGTSAVAADTKGGLNPTSLPIRAGELIGVDLAVESGVGIVAEAGAAAPIFGPAMPEDGMPHEPLGFFSDEFRLLLNASVLLAPTVFGLAPASGGTAGGDVVKIFGDGFDGATTVVFGSTPASSFSVDSVHQITAIAPVVPPSTVDVRVIGPGGTSAVSAGDRFTFTAPLPSPAAPPAPVAANVRPSLTGLSQRASRWRKGGLLPRISRATPPPVGTVFSFGLSEAATVRLTFAHNVAGRKVRGVCRAPGTGNATKPRCTRTVTAGTLALPGHAGANQVRFQGRLTSRKSLEPGRYAMVATARDAEGLVSAPQSLNFTVVRG